MPTFRGLTGNKAKLEFALSVLHTMPVGLKKALDSLFDEAKEGAIFDEKTIEDLRAHAKRILPVNFMYEENETGSMKEFREYRDKLLALCQ